LQFFSLKIHDVISKLYSGHRKATEVKDDKDRRRDLEKEMKTAGFK